MPRSREKQLGSRTGGGGGHRDPAILSWLRLMRVYQRVNAESARGLRSYGLSVGQFDVIAHLGSRKRTTQQELAGSLLVSKGNVSQILERMEASGLVVRCQEGRTKYLDLSPRGRAIYRKAVPFQEALVAGMFVPLTLSERQTLASVLKKLDKGIGRKGRDT